MTNTSPGNHSQPTDRILVLMGVSGCGKSTVGRVLAEQLGWPFVDADDFHPPANIDKMRRGVPLTDEDRQPWLAAIAQMIHSLCTRHVRLVLACSALKHAYQDYLREHGDCVVYVLLSGSPELIQQRLAARKGHFMDPKLLASQFAALEPPENAVEVDVTPSPDVIAAEIRKKLGL